MSELLRDKAYRELKRKICTLEFDLGEQLVEARICSELKLGRTPVREAIQQLAKEGLVVVLPRKGVYVSEISLWEFQRLLEARAMLELHCIRQAVALISSEQIQRLRSLFQEAIPLAERRDIPRLLEIDRSFHEGIVGILNNPFISEMAARVYDLVTRTWHLSFRRRTVEELKQTIEEHMAILNALEARDLRAAEQAVIRHLEQFQEKVTRRPFRDMASLGDGSQRGP